MKTREELIAGAEQLKSQAAALAADGNIAASKHLFFEAQQLESRAEFAPPPADSDEGRKIAEINAMPREQFMREFNALDGAPPPPETIEERFRRLFFEVTGRRSSDDKESDLYSLTTDEFRRIFAAL